MPIAELKYEITETRKALKKAIERLKKLSSLETSEENKKKLVEPFEKGIVKEKAKLNTLLKLKRDCEELRKDDDFGASAVFLDIVTKPFFEKYHGEYNKRDTSKNIVNKAENLEDLKKTMEEKGFDFCVEDGEIDFSVLKKVCVGIIEFLNDYDIPRDFLGAISTENMKPLGQATGGFYSKEDKVLVFNRGVAFNKFLTLKEMREEASGFFHAGDGYFDSDDLGYHEMSHVLSFLIANKTFNTETKEWLSPSSMCEEVYKRMKKNTKLKKLTFDDVKKTLSGYAYSDDEENYEVFAEALTDYYIFGENASPFSKELVKLTKEVLDKLKDKPLLRKEKKE